MVRQMIVPDAIDLVGDTDLDLVELIEHIEVRERVSDGELMRAAWRIISIEPARATATTCLVPYSWPTSTRWSPISSNNSVGNGPEPTASRTPRYR